MRSLDCPDDLAEFAASAALFWRFLSDWVRIVADHDLSSRIVVSHIRKATMGDRAYRNTQPFIRELSGSVHLFAGDSRRQGFPVVVLLPRRRNGCGTGLLRPARSNAFRLDRAWGSSLTGVTHGGARFVRGGTEGAGHRELSLLGRRHPFRSRRPPQERKHPKGRASRAGIAAPILLAGFQ